MKIRHRRKTFGIRNSIKQWFSKLERRIRRFKNYPLHISQRYQKDG